MELNFTQRLLVQSMVVLTLLRWLQGFCFLREAPERAIGSDKRVGKWGVRCDLVIHSLPAFDVAFEDRTGGTFGEVDDLLPILASGRKERKQAEDGCEQVEV